MPVKIEDVPKLIAAIRWGTLIVACIALFILEWKILGYGLLVAGLAFGAALNFDGFKIWFVGKVTGFGSDIVRQMIGQVRGVQGGPTIVSQAELAQNNPWAQPPASPPPLPSDGPRNYYRDPIPMSDAELAALLDRTAQPAIRLIRHWPLNTPAPQNSWFGGTPNLPDGVDWPSDPKSGLKLHHLAQIDLGEMPLFDGDDRLPRSGMMWFFANIDEELAWDEGPNPSTSRVVYHPTSTAGRAPVAIPDDLPEVDHIEGRMTGTHWNFRGPKIRCYPHWPLRGVQTVAWKFSDTPEGVTDPMKYHDALQARRAAVKAELVGVTVKRDYASVPLLTAVVEQRKRPDGSPFDYTRQDYDATKAGGRFPYHNRLGWHLSNWLVHDVTTNWERSDLARAGDENTLTQDQIKEGRAITSMRKRVDALRARLAQAHWHDALSPQDQAEIDDILIGATDPCSVVRFNNVFANSIIDLVAEAANQPELLDAVPAEVLSYVEDTTLPSHDYTDHFLLGPKSSATNPTPGYGVRLAQFDSDYALGWMFCDVGIIDFWMDEDDLAAGRWDQAWAATAGG